MRKFLAVTAGAILGASMLSAPADGADSDVVKSENAIPGRYIVVTKPGVSVSSTSVAEKADAKVVTVFKRALNGFVVEATGSEAERIADDPRVEAVYQDAKVSISDSQTIPKPPNSYWGLNRIDQRSLPSNSTSGKYNYGYTGAGVHAYVIDTGILTTHQEFGSRATFDFTSSDLNMQPDIDCHGHGTHVAGTIGGKTFGVAKQVKLHAVKVLDCYGTGTYSGIIEGVDWVTANAVKPAVVNMSLGGPKFAPLNSAVTRSIASGITYVVAAGNDDLNACSYSPGSTSGAITVASSGDFDRPYDPISDIRSWFSNWGTCVDLFAPGAYIKSAFADEDNSTAVMSGTSMASPHVTGVVALILQKSPKSTPASVASTLISFSTKGTVKDTKGSPNRELFAGGIPVLTMNAKPEPIKCSATVTVTGTLKLSGLPVSGRTVEIWYDRSGSTPAVLRGTAVTNSTGSYSKSFTQSYDGGWSVRYNGGVLIAPAKAGSDIVDCTNR